MIYPEFEETLMKLRMKSLLLVLNLLVLFFASPVVATLSLEGPKVQGGVLLGKSDPGVKVEVDGKSVRVSRNGLFLVGFGRDHPEQSRLKITYPDGRVDQTVIKVEKRKYRIQRVDGLPKRKMAPNKVDLKRIRKESAMVRKARSLDQARTDFVSGWSWPVTGPISGVYGSQRILNGVPGRPHFGVDIAVPTGTSVRAPADGIVTLVHRDMFYSGGTLIIDHGHKLSSSFLHLSRILVKNGTRVRKGDLIAEVGATGRVTGAHLDWRMNYYNHRVDPQLLVPPMPKVITQ